MPTVSQRMRQIRRDNIELVRTGHGKYVPRLKIDHQSFTIDYHDATKGQAEWMCMQLTRALYRFKYGSDT